MNNQKIEEILEVVKKYQNVVHTQDQEAFNELFAKKSECELISIKTKFQGKENIYQDFLINIIRKNYTVIDLVNDGIDVNIVNSNLAVVVFHYHTECIRREDGKPYGIEGLETQVIIKEEGTWRILHVHYSK